MRQGPYRDHRYAKMPFIHIAIHKTKIPVIAYENEYPLPITITNAIDTDSLGVRFQLKEIL